MQSKITTDFKKRFIKCFKDLHSTEDILAFMIRGHLYCESILVALLAKSIKRPDALDLDRLDFQLKLNLCNALGLIPESLIPGLAKLGQFRNRLAHRLDFSVSEKDQSDFINVIRSSGGPHIEYYLSKRTEFPNGLRRCILGMLIDLSLELADSDEQKKQMLVGLTVSFVKISGLEINEFLTQMMAEF